MHLLYKEGEKQCVQWFVLFVHAENVNHDFIYASQSAFHRREIINLCLSLTMYSDASWATCLLCRLLLGGAARGNIPADLEGKGEKKGNNGEQI